MHTHTLTRLCSMCMAHRHFAAAANISSPQWFNLSMRVSHCAAFIVFDPQLFSSTHTHTRTHTFTFASASFQSSRARTSLVAIAPQKCPFSTSVCAATHLCLYVCIGIYAVFDSRIWIFMAGLALCGVRSIHFYAQRPPHFLANSPRPCDNPPTFRRPQCTLCPFVYFWLNKYMCTTFSVVFVAATTAFAATLGLLQSTKIAKPSSQPSLPTNLPACLPIDIDLTSLWQGCSSGLIWLDAFIPFHSLSGPTRAYPDNHCLSYLVFELWHFQTSVSGVPLYDPPLILGKLNGLYCALFSRPLYASTHLVPPPAVILLTHLV